MTDDSDEKVPLTKAQRMMQAAEAAGFKKAPDDHPIYSEGPSITFWSGAHAEIIRRADECLERARRKDGGPAPPLTTDELDASETEIHNMLRRGVPKLQEQD